MIDAKSLYERDFVLWTEEQAEALRTVARGGTNQALANRLLDWENLSEEIESLGRSDKRELHSQIYRIVRHLLKLQYPPATDPQSGWRESIRDRRKQAQIVLADSLSLRSIRFSATGFRPIRAELEATEAVFGPAAETEA